MKKGKKQPSHLPLKVAHPRLIARMDSPPKVGEKEEKTSRAYKNKIACVSQYEQSPQLIGCNHNTKKLLGPLGFNQSRLGSSRAYQPDITHTLLLIFLWNILFY